MKKYFTAVILAVFWILSITPVLRVFADEDGQVGLKVTPVSERVQLNSGETIDKEITVVNQNDADTKIRVYAAPYSVEGVDYSPNFSNDTVRNQIVRWIEFDSEEGKVVDDDGVTKYEFPAPSQTEVKVSYSINVPDDAPDGGQYAVIFIESVNDENSSQGTSGISAVYRIGVIILANINGVTRDGAEIISTSFPFFYTSGDRRIIYGEATVKNTGNTDFPFTQTLKVSTIFGRELFNDSRSLEVFPETERTNRIEFADTPMIGIFKASYSVIILDQVQEKEQIVIVVPTFVLIILLVLLTIVIVWLIIFLRKRKMARAKTANQ